MAPLIALDVQSSHSGFAISNSRFAYPLRLVIETVDIESKPRKRVRFSNVLKQVINPEAEFYADDDIETKWWTARELESIKGVAKEMSTVLRRTGSHQDCSLTIAHHKTTLMLATNFKALAKLSKSTPDEDLQRWCSFTDGRRGLERFSSRDYCCFRKKDIQRTRLAVVREQEKQLQEGVCDVERIAQLAREASRRSRSFALFFAAADAKVADYTESQDEDEPRPRGPPLRKRSKIELDCLKAHNAATA